MKYPIAIFICLFSFWLSKPLHAQSLVQDTERLVRAFNDIEKARQPRSDTSTVFADTTTLNSQAQVMAILQNYNQSTLHDSLPATSLEEVLASYEDNPLISRVLREQQFALPDTLPGEFFPKFYESKQETQKGPRQKMLSLLHAEEAVSPMMYLSVPNTLEKYSLPPIKNVETTKIVAPQSNGNFSGGLLNPTAIVMGMFEFVLDKAKDEVVVSFLERMLLDDGKPFGKLFPTVSEAFTDRSFTYSNSLIQRLREALYHDIQLMSISLPNLMLEDDYFSALQSEPVAYNFLAVYSMLGMSMNDMPVEEIMPVTHRHLYQSYEEAIKEVNFQLADVAYGTEEYDLLIQLTDTILQQVSSLYQQLGESESALRQRVVDLKSTHQETLLEHPDWTAPDANFYLQKKAYDFEVLLGSSSSPGFDLGLLPSLLVGQLDSAYIMGFNTLRSYDRFFGEDKSERQWRAAGLELAKKLNGTWYHKENMTAILYAWQKDLADYSFELDKWENLIDPTGALQIALEKMRANQGKLVSTIRDSKNFWRNGITYNQRLAFELLAVIAESVEEIDDDPDFEDLPEGDRLQIKLDTLLAIETRLIALDNRLKEANPEVFNASPVDLYLEEKNLSTIPYAYLIPAIDELNTNLYKVDQQIALLEKKYAPLTSRARDNAKPVLQTTEFATQLLYGLSSGTPDKRWISREELDGMMDGGLRQNIFMGLMTQRLSKTKEIPLLSPAGVSKLVELTVTDLTTLPKYQELDTLVQKDTMAFYNRAAFVVNTLNRMMELPLFVSKTNIREFTPLKEQHPGMSTVPAMATQTLDFIYYLNVKDHRHAISTLLRLFNFMDNDINRKQNDLGTLALVDPDQGGKNRKSAIHYLQKYGDFMADLIDADEGSQVEDLLINLTDDKSTSRLKRTEQLTVSFNAYLGGNVGWEKWTASSIEDSDDGNIGLAPSIPVGITISRLFGKKRQSFSLFVSFLDLGSLLSYRSDADDFGEPVVAFRNVFKPGLQLHYNIPKSPFYLAVGGQYGPQQKKFKEQQKQKNDEVDLLRISYERNNESSIKTYYLKLLNKINYHPNFQKAVTLDYKNENKVLIVEYLLPTIEQFPSTKEFRYIKTRNEYKELSFSQTELDKLYDEIIYRIVLDLINVSFKNDLINAVTTIVFNGWSNAINKANGLYNRACILSVVCDKNEFNHINLSGVDPKECFKSLKGISANKISHLTPIKPIITIENNDKRFVSSQEIGIDSSTNLASMHWEDFEHLIREIFEKEFSINGGEVKVTQSSRDGGVDAIAFDPDPIRGGKIVIQAKRYTNIVGVSSVRDLYGTVMNEGATKGILVTTSDFGSDSFKFAKDKPLTLINGGNLLYLLEKHGYKARINIKEAKEDLK